MMIVFFESCTIKKNNVSDLDLLGKHLFYDTHLSINNTKSCASCHAPQFAFTDGYRTSISSLGENLLHNAPSLLNIQAYHFYDWANPLATNYIAQMQRPLYGKHPIELGLDMHWDDVETYLKNDSLYATLFTHSFPTDSQAISLKHVEAALQAFLLTLKSTNSAYDKYIAGDTSVFTLSEKRGLQLFRSKELACAHCHQEPAFTKASYSTQIDSVYINIGLYNVDNNNKYPADDNGIIYYTKKVEDDGKYKIPSLRNVAITSPYMHDGSVASLTDVIDIYARGGRSNATGDGKLNIYKHPLIKGFSISLEEKKDLISFLHTLTDTSYLSKDSRLQLLR